MTTVNPSYCFSFSGGCSYFLVVAAHFLVVVPYLLVVAPLFSGDCLSFSKQLGRRVPHSFPRQVWETRGPNP